VLPCRYHSDTALRSSLHILTRRTNGRSLITFPKSSALLEIGDHLVEKYFHVFLKRLNRYVIGYPVRKGIILQFSMQQLGTGCIVACSFIHLFIYRMVDTRGLIPCSVES
jgi:hypothetical protein